MKLAKAVLIALSLSACTAERASDTDPLNDGSTVPADSQDADVTALQAHLRQAVASYEGRLPLQIREDSQLVGLTTYDRVLEFTFKFQDITKLSGSIDNHLLQIVMGAVIKGLGCSNPRLAPWVAQGAVFRLRFLDDKNSLLGTHDIDQKACAAKS